MFSLLADYRKAKPLPGAVGATARRAAGRTDADPGNRAAIETHVHQLGRYLEGHSPFDVKHFTFMAYNDFAGKRGSMELYYPLATRQVQINLDDGVKVNYAKFGAALKGITGLNR